MIRAQVAIRLRQRSIQARPFAVDPCADRTNERNDRNEQNGKKHRVLTERASIFVFAETSHQIPCTRHKFLLIPICRRPRRSSLRQSYSKCQQQSIDLTVYTTRASLIASS